MSTMVEARYRYRLRVSNSQAVLLHGVFDSCRFVWNQTLGRWQDLWRYERIMMSYSTLAVLVGLPGAVGWGEVTMGRRRGRRSPARWNVPGW
jgi:hypothetical protein